MESPKLALEVVQLWAEVPQKEELYLNGTSVTIGDDAKASFMVPTELVSGGFTLAEADGDGWTLCIPPSAIARIESVDALGAQDIDITHLPVDAMGTRRVRMLENMRVRIELGAFSFFMRCAEATPKAEAAPFIKWSDHRWLIASGLAHVVFLGALFFAPPRAGALVLDMSNRDAERIRIVIEGVEEERLEQEQLVQEQSGQGGSSGAPMAGESGVAGAETETRDTGGGVQVRGRSHDRAVPLTAADVTQLNTLSVLNSFAASMTSINSPFGVANALGFADADAYGDLNSAIPGFSPGTGGFGMRGIGRGGCVNGDAACLAGTVGTGRDLNIGVGLGCDENEFARLVSELGRAAAVDRCSGTGARIGVMDGGGRHSRVPTIRTPGATVIGGLSREEIRRVVQRHLPEVRHCYEQALISRPDLEGRVSERFVIQPDGSVQGVSMADSSLGSAQAESCVTQAVSRWSFPQSPSPTIVTYPFTFVPAS